MLCTTDPKKTKMDVNITKELQEQYNEIIKQIKEDFKMAE